jgi:hypothetical protein
MLLVIVGGWIVWVAFFLISHFGPRPAPVATRPAIRWIWAGIMLFYAPITLAWSLSSTTGHESTAQ